MEYFKLLHLTSEPFSNSPDPAFFYASGQHKGCIQKLEIALRLRRGLNVVTGEVGTGKTTLCRHLIRTFSEDARISASLVLDPDFPDPRSFLAGIVHIMTGNKPGEEETIPAMKEHLKHYLFQKGVEEDQTIVLIVDEGQKMAPACLELLRELLNFETNEHKLLQIVIFAQTEFAGTLEKLPNLADRINLYYRLTPLSFRECRALVHHRLKNASAPEGKPSRLFSMPALWRIFRISGGYPRKIIHLSHQCLLAMIIQNRTTVGWRIVGACARRTFTGAAVLRPVPVGFALLFLLGAGFAAWHYTTTPQVSSHAAPEQPHRIEEKEPALHTAGAIDAEKPGPETPLTTNAARAASIPITEQPTVAEPTSIKEVARVEDLLKKSATQDDTSTNGPDMLGKIKIQIGDTLGGIIQGVYGSYTYRHHEAVLNANTRLVNPDRLNIGDTLVFPAVAEDATDMPDTCWWVSLGRESDLDTAVSVLRREADGPLPLRLLPHWNPEEGLVFHVVLKTFFDNPDEAEEKGKQVASLWTKQPEIVCLNRHDDLLFGSVTRMETDIKKRTSNIELPGSEDSDVQLRRNTTKISYGR